MDSQSITAVAEIGSNFGEHWVMVIISCIAAVIGITAIAWPTPGFQRGRGQGLRLRWKRPIITINRDFMTKREKPMRTTRWL